LLEKYLACPVAPDYPGFGHGDAPDAKNFSNTFGRLAEVTQHFTDSLGLKPAEP
jgi:hypothetical protein